MAQCQLLESLPSRASTAPQTRFLFQGNPVEGALKPSVHVASKDVKQHQFKYQILRNRSTTCHCSPLGYQAIGINECGYPVNSTGPSLKSIFLHFRHKVVSWGSVKFLAQIQVDAVSCFPPFHQCHSPVVEGSWVFQAQFAICGAMLTVTKHILISQVALLLPNVACSSLGLSSFSLTNRDFFSPLFQSVGILLVSQIWTVVKPLHLPAPSEPMDSSHQVLWTCAFWGSSDSLKPDLLLNWAVVHSPRSCLWLLYLRLCDWLSVFRIILFSW